MPEPDDEEEESSADDSPDSFLEAVVQRVREIDLEEDLSEIQELLWYRIQEGLGEAPASRRRVRGR
jgi:hypothetical protein